MAAQLGPPVTPPAQSSSITNPPDAPKWGSFEDDWQPYSQRRSARISSQRQTSSPAARTPSPKSSRPNRPQYKVTRAPRHDLLAGEMSSPRKRQSTGSSPAAGKLTSEGTSNAAAFLGPPPSGKRDSQTANLAAHLPTPSKTPSRKHAEQNEANIAAFRRKLFSGGQDEQAESSTKSAGSTTCLGSAANAKPHASPKRKARSKDLELSMDLDMETPTAPSFEIFTDSQDRVPEVDNTPRNPFLRGSVPNESDDAVQRGIKQKEVHVPGVGMVSVADAAKREDGMLVVFRGKLIFKLNPEGSSPMPSRGRLLFPNKPVEAPAQGYDPEAEEAPTDIEDHAEAEDQQQEVEDEEEEEPVTPTAVKTKKLLTTPKAPKFPNSPPETGPATRARRRIQDEASPSKRFRSSRSPFEDEEDPLAGTPSRGHSKRPASIGPLPTEIPSKRART